MGIPDLELQEQMAKGHPYAFNMGHGKMIPFKDYNEAGEALMERNMPEVLHNSQTKAVSCQRLTCLRCPGWWI